MDKRHVVQFQPLQAEVEDEVSSSVTPALLHCRLVDVHMLQFGTSATILFDALGQVHSLDDCFVFVLAASTASSILQ